MAGIAALAAWVGLACDPAAAPPISTAPTGGGGASVDAATIQAQVLDRTGYGPDPFSQARIEAIGNEAYIEEQLDPASIPDPIVEALLASRPTLEMSFGQLLESYPPPDGLEVIPVLELMESKMLRSIHSRRQLEQVLVDFWWNHFNVFAPDDVSLYGATPHERDAIRPYVLGRFEDMLRAVSRSPAMMFYLDNWLSTREGFEFMGEVRGLNENYARELLELHTVGVEGGYDQADVIAVARAFTGWTIGAPAIAGDDGFFFWVASHDFDAKSIMGGLEIAAGGGQQDGDDVLAYLATLPATARFLCTKLVVRFLDEDPPPAVVAACESAYLASDGHLGEATRAILLSEPFLSGRHAGAKVKRPLHFMASLARVTELETDGVAIPGSDATLLEVFIGFVDLLGEPLHQARPPTGYPDESDHWANGGNLITRLEMVDNVTTADVLFGIDWGASGGSHAEVTDAVASKLTPGGLDPRTRAAVIAHLTGLVGFPDAARAREAAALILSSPDFMRH